VSLPQSNATRSLVYDDSLRSLRGVADKSTVPTWGSWEQTHVMVYRLEEHHLVFLHSQVRRRASPTAASP
jgi:hypothetical protein